MLHSCGSSPVYFVTEANMVLWINFIALIVTIDAAASRNSGDVLKKGNTTEERRSGELKQIDCWDLAAPKQKLKKTYVIRDVSTSSLEECLFECENALFTCRSVDFGFNQKRGNGTCHLSDWHATALDFSGATDSTPDPNFNVFGKNIDNPSARSSLKRSHPVEPILCDSSTSASYLLSNKFSDNSVFAVPQPWMLHLPDVCFSRAATSRRLTTRFVRKSHDVTNLEACQLLCARETVFDCRGFNFRKSPSSSVSACELTTDNSRSIDVSSAFAFVEDHDSVFYEKVGKGTECDKYVDGYGNDGYSDTNGGDSKDPSRWSFQASISGESHKPILSGTNGCFRRSKNSYRLSEFIARQSLEVRSQIECEQECLDSKRFSCLLFSFSFFSAPVDSYNRPRDRQNCFLSDKEPRSLDSRRDVIWDADSDIFEKVSSQCPGYQYSNFFTTTKPYDVYTSKCFKKTRTGIRVLPRLVKKTSRVKTPLDCEDECLRVKIFTCRAFSFRYYGSINALADNCELSDVDASSAGRDLLEDRNYDTWQRTDLSRNCGKYGGGHDDYDAVSVDSCFVAYKSNTRIDLRAVKESVSVRSLSQCEQECAKSKRYKCSSFSYRGSSSGYGQLRANCELSLWDATELDRSRELVYDPDYNVYARSAKGICDNYGGDDYGNLNGFGYTNEVSASGVSCVRRCQENSKMGYWFCETDERGSWDYCCAPTSKCSYGQGQPIAWCFVGLTGRTQWRPCSEKHAERPFAYLQSRAPPNVTSSSILATIVELSTELDRTSDRLAESGEESVTSRRMLVNSRNPKLIEVNGGDDVIVNIDSGLMGDVEMVDVAAAGIDLKDTV